MKKHSLLLSVCSVLSIAVLLHALFSCSGKQASGDEQVSEAEAAEIISEEGSTEESGALSEATGEEKKAEKKSDMSELESAIGENKEEAGEPESTLGASDEPKAGTEGESIAGNEDTPSESLESLEGSGSGTEVAKNDNTNPTENPPEVIPEPAGDAPNPPAETFKETKTPKVRTARKAVTVSQEAKVPEIPGKAIEKSGAKLNRFYFSRKGDNPKKVSELIYGNANHAKDLKSWNPGTWVPGKLIYYSSPVSADDSQMQSFYQERSIPFEPYKVGAKDSLFSIAQKQFGARGSWKEIAVVSGLDSAKVEEGKELVLYPKDLKAAAKAAVAKAPKEPKVEPPKEAVKPPSPQPDPNVGAPPPVAENTPPKAKPTTAPAEENGIMEIIQKQMLFIVIGGAALVLLVLLVLMGKKKKKKPSAEDFSDEGFSAPPKLKKRK